MTAQQSLYCPPEFDWIPQQIQQLNRQKALWLTDYDGTDGYLALALLHISRHIDDLTRVLNTLQRQ